MYMYTYIHICVDIYLFSSKAFSSLKTPSEKKQEHKYLEVLSLHHVTDGLKGQAQSFILEPTLEGEVTGSNVRKVNGLCTLPMRTLFSPIFS